MVWRAAETSENSLVGVSLPGFSVFVATKKGYSQLMELLTVGDVARELGVTQHTVSNWVRRGILVPAEDRGRQSLGRFKESDVETLKDFRSKGMSFSDMAVIAMQAHVSSRETEKVVKRLLSVLGANVPVLLVDAEELILLRTRAKKMLDIPWEPSADEVLEWSRTFYALGEEHLRMLEFTTGDGEPWKAFTELAKKLGLQVAQLAITDREMDLAYGYLNLARRSLRDVAYLYVRSQHGKDRAAKVFPLSSGDPHEEVLALIFPS